MLFVFAAKLIYHKSLGIRNSAGKNFMEDPLPKTYGLSKPSSAKIDGLNS
jgi:hypothetical protein